MPCVKPLKLAAPYFFLRHLVVLFTISTCVSLYFRKSTYTPHGEKSDRGHFYFDLNVDLNPLFNWNTKQLFLYLTAEYETKANVRICTILISTDGLCNLFVFFVLFCFVLFVCLFLSFSQQRKVSNWVELCKLHCILHEYAFY